MLIGLVYQCVWFNMHKSKATQLDAIYICTYIFLAYPHPPPLSQCSAFFCLSGLLAVGTHDHTYSICICIYVYIYMYIYIYYMYIANI